MKIQMVTTTSVPFELEKKFNKLPNKRQKKNFFFNNMIDIMQIFIDLGEKMLDEKSIQNFEFLYEPIKNCNSKITDLVSNGVEDLTFIPCFLEIQNLILAFQTSCIGLLNMNKTIKILSNEEDLEKFINAQNKILQYRIGKDF